MELEPRDAGTMEQVLSRSGAVQKGNWTKVLLSDAVADGAVCLDGSPGGFFIRRNDGVDPRRWIVFHQGGGWCGSDANCASRAATDLGSSVHWPSTYNDLYEGSRLFDTPPFDRYTVVYAMYCDGGSWAGNVSAPVRVANSTIYYRGRRILDALLENLLHVQGMNAANELLYAGCSAGALTTYLHADYVRSRMPVTARVLALADAMFSLKHDAFGGSAGSYVRAMQWGFTAWCAAPSVNQACLEAQDAGQGYLCLFGAVAARYVSTPLFVLNAKYDTWQEKAIIGVDCPMSQCNASVQRFWAAYGELMTANADVLPLQHGAFLHGCSAHCQSGISLWENATVANVSMRIAFLNWHAAIVSNSTAPAARHIDRCDVTPCAGNRC